MILQPSHVLIPRTVELVVNLSPFDQGRIGTTVTPMVNFRVAIGKRKAAGIVMIESRQIIETILGGLVRIAFHEKIAPIDRIWPLIEKYKRLGRSGSCKISSLKEDPRAPGKGPTAVGAAKPAQIKIHGHAAHARFIDAPDSYKRFVGGAFPNGKILSAIRPNGAFHDVLLRVPVGTIAWRVVHLPFHPRGLERAAIAGERNPVVMVFRIHAPSQAELAMIAHALNANRFGFAL